MTQVEFINTCPCCDGYGDVLRDLKKKYPDQLELTIYYVGKDLGYLEKYGPISQGTLIINGLKRYENLTRRKIEQAVYDAMGVGL